MSTCTALPTRRERLFPGRRKRLLQGCRLTSETRALKGMNFQLVETKRHHPRVNRMSSCIALPCAGGRPTARLERRLDLPRRGKTAASHGRAEMWVQRAQVPHGLRGQRARRAKCRDVGVQVGLLTLKLVNSNTFKSDLLSSSRTQVLSTQGQHDVNLHRLTALLNLCRASA